MVWKWPYAHLFCSAWKWFIEERRGDRLKHIITSTTFISNPFPSALAQHASVMIHDDFRGVLSLGLHSFSHHPSIHLFLSRSYFHCRFRFPENLLLVLSLKSIVQNLSLSYLMLWVFPSSHWWWWCFSLIIHSFRLETIAESKNRCSMNRESSSIIISKII